jgi:hypothetical protein
MATSQPRALTRLRKVAMALPGATEVEAWGEPTFRAGKMFAMYANAKNHHGGGRAAVWVKAAPGRQERMVRTAPDRFFVPPYMGPSGWIGVWLDGDCNWEELVDILKDAWRLVAPRKLQQGVS